MSLDHYLRKLHHYGKHKTITLCPEIAYFQEDFTIPRTETHVSITNEYTSQIKTEPNKTRCLQPAARRPLDTSGQIAVHLPCLVAPVRTSAFQKHQPQVGRPPRSRQWLPPQKVQHFPFGTHTHVVCMVGCTCRSHQRRTPPERSQTRCDQVRFIWVKVFSLLQFFCVIYRCRTATVRLLKRHPQMK